MNINKQLEPDMKAATINRLLAAGLLNRGNTVINEFTLAFHTRRADLVITGRDRLLGFEIKSDSDTLDRLEGQINTYLEYFDKVIVVSAPKHIPNILKAVPSRVEVWENANDKIKVRQRGQIIPIKNPSKLIDIMTVQELLKLANELNIKIENKRRRNAAKALLSAPINKLRRAVIRALEKRYNLSSQDFWRQVADKAISAEDIEYLSPYRLENIAKKEREKAIEYFSLALT